MLINNRLINFKGARGDPNLHLIHLETEYAKGGQRPSRELTRTPPLQTSPIINSSPESLVGTLVTNVMPPIVLRS